MSVNYQVEWPMSLRAPADSLEAKQPAIDNGLDVPDPARYYSADYMQKEWALLWPRVWLLAGVTPDVPEPGDYCVFEIGHEEFMLVRQNEGSIKAFYETYHLPHIHPQTQGVMEDFSQYDLYPNGFSRMIVPIGVKSHRVGDQVSVDPYQEYMMQEAGIDPATFSGTAREVRTAIQQAKRARGKRFG